MSSPVTPKDAAAVVLLKNKHDPQVFWVKRGPSLRFMAGYHAFPGGQIDEDDASIKVLNCEDASTARVVACAAREILEETGVLIAEGQRASFAGTSEAAARRGGIGRDAVFAPPRTRRVDARCATFHPCAPVDNPATYAASL